VPEAYSVGQGIIVHNMKGAKSLKLPGLHDPQGSAHKRLGTTRAKRLAVVLVP